MGLIKQPLINKHIKLAGMATALAFCFAAQSTLSAPTNYYRWVDEKGTIHFTDKPPKGAKAEPVQMGKKPSPQLLEDQQAAQASSETSEAASERDSKQAKRCAQERKRLAVLKSNTEVSLRDADGNVTPLSGDELKEEIAFSERAVQLYCKP